MIFCVSVADTISADDKVGSEEYQKVCVTIWYCWYGCLSIEWIIWQYQGGVWLVQIWYQIIECGGWFKLVAESCKNLCICVSQDYIPDLYEVICFYFQGHLHFHGCVHFWGCLYCQFTHFQHVLHLWSSSSFKSSLQAQLRLCKFGPGTVFKMRLSSFLRPSSFFRLS